METGERDGWVLMLIVRTVWYDWGRWRQVEIGGNLRGGHTRAERAAVERSRERGRSGTRIRIRAHSGWEWGRVEGDSMSSAGSKDNINITTYNPASNSLLVYRLVHAPVIFNGRAKAGFDSPTER